VNFLDLLLVLAGVSAAVAGYRLGLLARALSWAGMALGLVLAARLLPTFVALVDRADPGRRLFVAVAVLLGGAFVGQALGLLVGGRARHALPQVSRPLDRTGGAVAGLLSVLVALWLLLPALAALPGTVALQARTSWITQALDDAAPDPPDTLRALRRLVGDNRFPEVFSSLRPAPDLGPPPADSGMSEAVAALTAASTVRVEGIACSRFQEGSGFVAAPGLVVTNAHVVAGVDETQLIRRDGTSVPARVVLFDSRRDLALLEAPDLGLAPLPLAADPAVGARGAVFGYPAGGDLQLSPFELRDELEAVGRDLYDRAETRRSVLILASGLAPGDSGGAVVAAGGGVVGVAFAIAPDQPGTAYALAVDEVRAVLGEPRGAVDTGECLG
jgi:S1-C subfamily serine protease